VAHRDLHGLDGDARADEQRAEAVAQLGVRRGDGRNLPTCNLPAALIVGDSGDDRGYLVYRNFCSIMRYNPAFRYALAVGFLADAIG
jgi:membrane-bound lytic murein transglycosylase B